MTASGDGGGVGLAEVNGQSCQSPTIPLRPNNNIGKCWGAISPYLDAKKIDT